MGHEKVARLLFAFVFGYCFNFCIYAMLRTRAIFSWPTRRVDHENTNANANGRGATFSWPILYKKIEARYFETVAYVFGHIRH